MITPHHLGFLPSLMGGEKRQRNRGGGCKNLRVPVGLNWIRKHKTVPGDEDELPGLHQYIRLYPGHTTKESRGGGRGGWGGGSALTPAHRSIKQRRLTRARAYVSRMGRMNSSCKF